MHEMENVSNTSGMVNFVSRYLDLESRPMRQALVHMETIHLDVGWLFLIERLRMNVHMVISEGGT